MTIQNDTTIIQMANLKNGQEFTYPEGFGDRIFKAVEWNNSGSMKTEEVEWQNPSTMVYVKKATI